MRLVITWGHEINDAFFLNQRMLRFGCRALVVSVLQNVSVHAFFH